MGIEAFVKRHKATKERAQVEEIATDEDVVQEEKRVKSFGQKGLEALDKEAEMVAVALDAESIQRDIARLLKFSTFQPELRFWLDTGWPELNGVFGSRDKGIPYGKVLELAGTEHAGKSTLSVHIAGMAQREGAGVGRVDLEDSRDEYWDKKLGLNSDSVVDIYPKLVIPKAKQQSDDDEGAPAKPARGKKKKKTKMSSLPRLQSAEELFAEMEVGMARMAALGCTKQFWIVDSVANIQTEMQLDAGTMGRNMRTSLDRAMFLSQELPTLAGLAANYNALIFLVNQMRDKQGMVFGDPSYSPGGRALRHCCSIRARVRRCKNGILRKGTKIIGLVGIIKNLKNKAGGGSVQDLECGFCLRWNKPLATAEFMTREEAEEAVKG